MSIYGDLNFSVVLDEKMSLEEAFLLLNSYNIKNTSIVVELLNGQKVSFNTLSRTINDANVDWQTVFNDEDAEDDED